MGIPVLPLGLMKCLRLETAWKNLSIIQHSIPNREPFELSETVALCVKTLYTSDPQPLVRGLVLVHGPNSSGPHKEY
ncbi:hypothetical protein TNCV_4997841 [Trichonephila clavipes]|nr:hypothetical protein TNCV_4997841 [Trichonephila clavipes]